MGLFSNDIYSSEIEAPFGNKRLDNIYNLANTVYSADQ